MRILVAEDERRMADLLERIFQEEGHQVVVALRLDLRQEVGRNRHVAGRHALDPGLPLCLLEAEGDPL